MPGEDRSFPGVAFDRADPVQVGDGVVIPGGAGHGTTRCGAAVSPLRGGSRTAPKRGNSLSNLYEVRDNLNVVPRRCAVGTCSEFGDARVMRQPLSGRTPDFLPAASGVRPCGVRRSVPSFSDSGVVAEPAERAGLGGVAGATRRVSETEG